MGGFFPKLSVSNYPEMLAKIAWSFFGLNCVLLYITRVFVPPIDSFLSYYEKYLEKVPYFSELKSFNVLIAVALAVVVSYAFRLHDKLSDILFIRRDFDIYHILQPLIILCNVTVSDAIYDKLLIRRGDVMQRVFYQYASSAKSATIVDKHDIITALTNWSWFWIILESVFQLWAFSFVFYAFAARDVALYLLVIGIALLLVARYIYRSAITIVLREVRQISNTPNCCKEVKDAINAL